MQLPLPRFLCSISKLKEGYLQITNIQVHRKAHVWMSGVILSANMLHIIDLLFLYFSCWHDYTYFIWILEGPVILSLFVRMQCAL